GPGPSAPLSPAYAAPLKELAASSNALGIDLYRAARKGYTNLAISPVSISMALTMAWAGARGAAASQMKDVIHATNPASEALDTEAKALSWARDPAQAVTLRIANRLFGEKSYDFDPGYLDRTRTAFGAPLEPLDFAGDAAGSRRHINAW